MAELVRFAPEYLDQIRNAVISDLLERGLLNQPRAVDQGRDQEFYGVLQAALSAPTNGMTGATTVEVKILKKNQTTGNLEDTGLTETITHRFENIAVADDTLCRFKYVAGELALTAVDCGAMASPP